MLEKDTSSPAATIKLGLREQFGEWKECTECGDDVHIERWALGYRVCKGCGEAMARDERASWCVVMEYGKGNYQYVTPTSARATLLNTNQKQQRG
jgi:hypothetical protein